MISEAHGYYNERKVIQFKENWFLSFLMAILRRPVGGVVSEVDAGLGGSLCFVLGQNVLL